TKSSLTRSVEICLSCCSLTKTTSEDESTFSLTGSAFSIRVSSCLHPISPKVMPRIKAMVQVLKCHLLFSFILMIGEESESVVLPKRDSHAVLERAGLFGRPPPGILLWRRAS